MSFVLFLLLATLGTYYIHSVLHNYKGNSQEVYIAWSILCIITTYNLFTLYYDSLLQGKGLVKESKQIIIIGQVFYLFIAAILIMTGFGIIAIVSALASSVIIVRWLSYRTFFTHEIKQKLHNSVSRSKNEILKAIFPNALKIGLTSLGGFTVQKSAIIFGSLFLTLNEIASYGITMQLIAIISGLAGIYTTTFQPKIAQLRIENNTFKIKELYLKGQIVLLLTYIFGGLALLGLGEWALTFIGSKTHLIPSTIILVALIISLLENNHSIAGGILLSSNEVPFFKASLIAGATTIILLIIMFYFGHLGLWALILAPGIAHLYNNWRWPYEVIKQLNISKQDIKKMILRIINIPFKKKF
jgi:O-antigen/teichoic acid export membrane protein